MNLAQVKGFYTSKRTEGASSTTYATPSLACTAQEIAAAYTKNPQKIHESGNVVLNRTYISDAKLTLTTHTMPLAKQMEFAHGLPVPAAGAGYEIGDDSVTPSYYAVGWPEQIVVGGVTQYLCTWYYKSMMMPPDETYKTANESGYQIDPHAIEWSCERDQHTGLMRRQQIVANLTAVDEFFSSVIASDEYTAIGAAVYTVEAPVKEATAQTTHASGTGYTAAISWSPTPAAGDFAAATAYTATVTYTAATGYIFALGFGVTDMQGLPASGTTSITVTRVSATSVTAVVAYTATAA